MIPPKPAARAGRVSLWRYARLLRRDILSAQPEKLYRAWMADFRTPLFRSVLINQPELVSEVLRERPADFPKSERVTRGLRDLLGRAVFVTNGDVWERQRRLIDPAFEGGRIAATYPAMSAAAEAAVARLVPGRIEVEAWASHFAADVIFRTLFSLPIEDDMAAETYTAFRAFQRTQPVLRRRAVLPLLRHVPVRQGRAEARALRRLITDLVVRRDAEIQQGVAPDDLATRLLSATIDGDRLSPDELVDQVAIFFLAGHETSAAAIAWALYLLATHGDAQDEVASEARRYMEAPSADALRAAVLTRDVLKETLRLYPPVPMMVRQTTRDETFRERRLPVGTQVVISPWHLHRQVRLWPEPDAFDPWRWRKPETREIARGAWIPFSAGPRACPGAGFATAEVTLILIHTLAAWRILPTADPPVPVAHLTVRAANGIFLEISKRNQAG